MQSTNPYTAPRSEVSGGEPVYGEVRVFSAKGRIGRVRYVAYTIGLSMLISMVMGVTIGFIGSSADALEHLPVLVVGYGLILVIHALLSIQRAHDFNAGGWFAVMAFVPLLNLLFWFIPGTGEGNRFGPRPPPNGPGTTVLACILPVLFAIGVVAAIVLPAYHQYLQNVERPVR
jgi:uncharacterized membrane protein YhaH (DUF805 family)